jgi:hypothetical protein
MGSAYTVFVGKPERNRPLGKPTCKCDESIKRDLNAIG